MGKPKKPQTLEIGEYFKTDFYHQGGMYKVLDKVGNFYFVYSKDLLKGDCHTMFQCPFTESQHIGKCKAEEVTDKTNGWAATHYTCMLIDPNKVKKVPKLIALLELEI